ncbi:hypothetical protein C8R43DRAFT_1116694 [Mycena crocata]|nr:hypothetical protein C8R43DRAFT_1116694 [Mycena crocata]
MSSEYLYSSESESDSKFPNRLYHSFHEIQDDGGPPGMWAPQTILELQMCCLSADIRRKPRWWEKLWDETIRMNWIQGRRTSVGKWTYAMSELDGYARLRDPESGIEWGPYERIFSSDTLIPQKPEYGRTYGFEVVLQGEGTWIGTAVDSVSGERVHIEAYTLPEGVCNIESSQEGFVEWYLWNVEKAIFGAPSTSSEGSVGMQELAYEYHDCAGKVAFDTALLRDGVVVETGFEGMDGFTDSAEDS